MRPTRFSTAPPTPPMRARIVRGTASSTRCFSTKSSASVNAVEAPVSSTNSPWIGERPGSSSVAVT